MPRSIETTGSRQWLEVVLDLPPLSTKLIAFVYARK